MTMFYSFICYIEAVTSLHRSFLYLLIAGATLTEAATMRMILDDVPTPKITGGSVVRLYVKTNKNE